MRDVSIAVSGNGVMGQLVRRHLTGASGLTFAGAVGPGDYDSLFEIPRPIQGIIDFSHPDFLQPLIDYATRYPAPVVIATTGYDQAQVSRIHKLAESVPVVFSANYSPGVTILNKVLQGLSSIVISQSSTNWDIEIVEMHHNRKLDAPSGTALALADAIDGEHALPRVCGRSGHAKRGKEIGLHAIRGGSVSGKHSVILASPDEVLTFSHEAQDRSVFAAGAILAMKFALTRKPGLYTMEDVLFSFE